MPALHLQPMHLLPELLRLKGPRHRGQAERRRVHGAVAQEVGLYSSAPRAQSFHDAVTPTLSCSDVELGVCPRAVLGYL